MNNIFDKIKRPYYYVPPCPVCGSRQTGRFTRSKDAYNDNWSIREALKNGKEELIENLEDSLYKRAMGYEYEETKTIREKDDNGKDKVKLEITKKKLHPDTGALAFALKNLAPDRWKDRHDIEHAGRIDHEINQELAERIEEDEDTQKILDELWEKTKPDKNS